MAGATLAAYVRHAERFGCDGVFEAASADLDASDLGRLSLRLQNLDAKWRMPRADRERLALRLVESGEPVDRACRMAQIGRTTLWRLRNGQDSPKSAPEPAVQSGVSVSNRGTEGNGSRTAVEASDGPYRKAA